MSSYGQNVQPQTVAPAGGAAASGSPDIPAIAGIAGSALALIGSFLAWSKISAEGQSETFSGMDGDGMWTLIASLVAGALFAVGMVAKKHVATLSALVPTLITLVIAILNVASPDRTVRADGESEGVSSADLDMYLELLDVSAGLGIYVVLIGALAALGGGALAAVKARKA